MIKKLAHRFFAWYCRRELYETISGDLEELYQRRKSLRTPGYASRRLAWDVLLLLRPGIVRPFGIVDLNHVFDMFRNYLTIGLRNLRKHPVNTLIHVLGLALGLAAFLLLHHYTRFEKSYDLFHQEPHQLYRLTTDDVKEGRIQVRDAMSFAPSGRALQEDIPEVVGSTTTYKTWRMVFRKGSEPVEENDVIAVDSNFLHLFNYPVLQGNVDDMLTKPHSIVLTEDQAAKYFGTDDPMGKTVHVLGSFDRPFEVTGVIGNVPPNTHYTFNTLVSLSSFSQQIENDAWDGFNYYTYLKLRPDADLAKVRAMLPALSKKYLGDETRLQFNLQPVPEIHLHSDFTYEPEIHGSVTAVRFLGIISVLILIIAWFNYINLSTARAIERAREVGLRKVIGAQRKQLVIQFLTEALMINLMGALCALLLAQLCLPYFHGLVGKPVISSVLGNHAFMRDLGIFFLAGTLLTGLYPALVLSSFKPISVLRGSFGRSRQGTLLRKALVTLQFTASLVLISGTIIIYKQIRHMTAADLGIDTAQVIGFDNADLPQMSSDERRSTYDAFAEELRRVSAVEEVGAISNLPGGGSAEISSNSGGVRIIGMTDRQESTVYITIMNDKAVPTLGIDLLAGRNFDRELAIDTSAVIINRALLHLLNVPDPESVINKQLQFGRNPDSRRYTIVGVMDDYNRSSLKHNVEPTVFVHRETAAQSLVKLTAARIDDGLQAVRSTWSNFFPDAPLEYAFLDERFERLYQEDKRFGLIFLNFAILAILVASMGLFGLASYLAVQRTKEVGIRKVLGASVTNIVILFFRDFLLLIIIAIVIGIPLVYIGMSDWLNGFAYRLAFPWWVLVVAVIAMVILTFFTVSFQTWKLALLNPAKTVRHE